MATIFTKIINGDLPSYKLGETEDYFAFLDISPRVIGHALVIPKIEVDKFFDLDQDTYIGLMIYAKRVAEAIEKEVDCDRVGLAVVGLEVPHVHIHLLPITEMSDFSFAKPVVEMSKEEMQDLADRIATHL